MVRWHKVPKAGTEGEEASASEQLLFGGKLVYDTSWSHHDGVRYSMGIAATAAALPRLLGLALRLAWQTDRRSVLTVLMAEVGRGVAQAAGLLGINTALSALLVSGDIPDRLRAVAPVAVLLAVFAAVGALCAAISTRFSEPLGPRVERLVRQTYLERACRVEMSAMEDHEFHRLLQSARWGASAARRMVEQSVLVITSLLSLVAMGGVLSRLHWSLMIMLVMMVAPNAWSTLTVARHRYNSFHRWLQHDRASQRLCTLLTDTDAAPEVRVHNVGPWLLDHHRQMSEAEEAEQDRLARVAARLKIAASALTGLLTVATYALLTGLLWHGILALAGAGTAVVAIRQGTGTLAGLFQRITFLHRESLHVGDLDKLLAASEEQLIPEGGRPLPEQVDAIDFQDVTFCYPGAGNAPALRGVSLTIPAGKIVALVGENGSGKTTLAKLICGLYTADKGRVLWGGVDTSEADRAEIFRRCALVQQDHVRWPMTARVNVAISETSGPISQQRVVTAAREAGADFVEELPNKWDTLLSRTFKRGVQLSGGQWQRIGIARARYRGGEMFIVDEPTAALDAKAEEAVFAQLRSLAATGQSIVLITHRMASVRGADLVHVLHEGELVESGAPEELLAQPGSRFREMYEVQAAQFRQNLPSQPGPASVSDAREGA